ncbi:hypothetical protein CYMTET_43332 [Cymbomonas tetramitiformis]|uniref:C-type lectin domain-containing protein n=1 Tax=Cymbomonas tetramitiformis TaxID=36881 RepID=A0AAE0F034_9CHLO|nr:hypothetical protein CYMTET_43332 [Cymbomonas tetramitiformis]
MDPFQDANWSSVVGMKEGYRVFTNVPEVGLTETVAVTHADGMYIAGEKVATVREVQGVSSELQHTRAELQDTRAELSHIISTLATLQSSCSHPPVCMGPGGDKLQFNGTHWLCVCTPGYYGESCQFGPTDAPTLSPTTHEPTSASPTAAPTAISTSPTSTPTTTPPTDTCDLDWHHFNNHCYFKSTEANPDILPSDARAACHAVGAELTSIQSAEENDFIASLAARDMLWLGGSDITREGAWTWHDGTAWSYQNWWRGSAAASNTRVGEEGQFDCLMMNYAIWHYCGSCVGEWSHYPCNGWDDGYGSQRRAKYICKKGV